MQEEKEAFEGVEEGELRDDDDGLVGEDLQVQLAMCLQLQFQGQLLVCSQEVAGIAFVKGERGAVELQREREQSCERAGESEKKWSRSEKNKKATAAGPTSEPH